MALAAASLAVVSIAVVGCCTNAAADDGTAGSRDT
jgi:hypothetical protein